MPVVRIDAGWVVAHQAGTGHTLLRDGVVVYDGGTVVHVGEDWDGQADEVVDARDELVLPGFVNAHTHAFSPLTRSYLEDLGSPVLGGSTTLYTHLPWIRAAVRDDDMTDSIAFSLVELLKGGTTTAVVLQTSNTSRTVPTAHALAELCAEWGVRAYVSPMHASGSYRVEGDTVHYDWDEERGHQALDEAAVFVKEAGQRYGGLVRGMLGPRQTALCRPDLLERTAALADELDTPVQVHASEALPEVRALREWYGVTPVEYLHDAGLLGPHLILGHCIYVGGHSLHPEPSRDLALISEAGASVAHCPWIFARRGTKLESFGRYREAGINLAIGTDSFPQDMLAEQRWALVVGKLADSSNDAVAIRDVFEAATLGGARALGRDDLGRLEAGSAADLVGVRMTGMRMAPVRDPLRNLLYSASSADVSRVVVAGRELVRDGRATFVDEEAVAGRLQEAAERVWARMPGLDEISPPALPPWR